MKIERMTRPTPPTKRLVITKSKSRQEPNLGQSRVISGPTVGTSHRGEARAYVLNAPTSGREGGTVECIQGTA